MTTLYEITNDIQRLDYLLSTLEEDDTDTEEAIKDTMESLQLMLQQKNSNIIRYVLDLNKKSDIISDEIKRLQALKKQADNRVDRIKEYVSDVMIKLNYNKVETDFGTFSFRKSESVEIEDSTKIPDEFVEVVIERKPDKTAIKKAIKDNKVVEGVKLVTKNNLQVK